MLPPALNPEDVPPGPALHLNRNVFVNGLAIVGAQPLDAFTSVIDKELAGQIPK